ncbi:MAG: MopE-related protein [Chitinophagales bacterium]
MVLFAVVPQLLSASHVTGLNGFYRNGQVFLTWTNQSNQNNYYKVYRSQSPITHGWQLSACEYLGWTVQKSALDFDLTAHYNQNNYLCIDSGGTPLPPSKGLMVATTLASGNYYYAVTIKSNNSEDTTLLYGVNSLMQPIVELVKTPQPVFQKTILISGRTTELYTSFVSFKREITQASMMAAGFMASDFLLYRNNNSGNQPLTVKFHGGGSDLFSGITTVSSNEMNLNLEFLFPNGDNGGFWGANSTYDIYKKQNTVPASGINNNFFQQMYKATIDWAIQHLSIDSNRIYLSGSSAGACGAVLYALTYPEKIAAVHASVPCFNIGFQNDSVAFNSLNPGQKNRKDVDALLGKMSTNLPCNLGYNTVDAVNCAWLLHHFKNRDLPPIYAINGKSDVTLGWTEKPMYYDSVNANDAGGYYFWDEREHDGTGGFWTDNNFDVLRYSRNKSYPAFSNCSLNEYYGVGIKSSGAPYGSVNGSMDWVDNVTDSAFVWKANCLIRGLNAMNDLIVVYPDSGTVDITPRRRQQFLPPPHAIIYWSVIHKGQTIQSGDQVFEDGIITLSQIKIFKDTSQLQLRYSTTDTFYKDNDYDGFGNHSVWVMGSSSVSGYVSNDLDCNDATGTIHPGAQETCNNIDDNCNGETDEIAGTAFYADADMDGFGNPGAALTACAAPSGYVADNSDCNDVESHIYPGATEVCNGLDDNCDAQIDDGVQSLFYPDADGDGYGDAEGGILSCVEPVGFVESATDCNDDPASGGFAIHPDATEACNGIDDDCDTQTDEGGNSFTYYRDDDSDGYGNAAVYINSCDAVSPSGYVLNSSDCNDDEPGIHPGTAEVCNSLDDDCDTQIDEGVVTATVVPSGSITICTGTSILLQANTGANLIYQWKKDGINISGATLSTYNASSEAVYSVAVAIGVCSVISANTTVNTKALPKSSITPSGTIKVCPGATATLEANTGTGLQYQWKNGGASIAGATASSYSTIVEGSYTVIVTNGTGCTKLSPTSTIENFAGATAKITTVGKLNICEAGFVVLNAKVTAGYTYIWYKDDLVISGVTGTVYTAIIPGTYKYLATTQNGCTQLSGGKIVTGCKLENVDAENDVSMNVYPNPSDGSFHLDFQTDPSYVGEVTICMINAIGQKVYTENTEVVDGMLSKSISLKSDTPTGIYWLRIITDEVVFNRPVSIVN